MQEELIKFDTAKLAKKKRFHTTSKTKYYNNSTGQLISNIGKLAKHIPYQAPTQSLLQKWLREVHGLVVESVNYFSLTKYSLRVHTIENDEFMGTVIDSVRDIKNRVTYKSYEQALEQGLIEALKLIK